MFNILLIISIIPACSLLYLVSYSILVVYTLLQNDLFNICKMSAHYDLGTVLDPRKRTINKDPAFWNLYSRRKVINKQDIVY